MTLIDTPKAPEATPAVPDKMEATPPNPTDAAAREALRKASEVQGARVDLAEEAAPKPPESQPASPAPPTPSSTPDTPIEELTFTEKVANHYAVAIAQGGNWLSAGLSTVAYALTSGSGKFWDLVKGLFDGKGKEDADVAPAKAKGFLENIKSLLSEFGLTETADKKKNFFLVATELAKEVQTKYGVPYQICLGQACLETGYGTSDLVQRAFNSFGMQALGSYAGERSGSYRSYGSLRESFMDYGKLLATSTTYKTAFEFRDNPKRFLEEIKKAGYAKDPNYVAKVEGVLSSNGVTLP